jgi:hypothetical protein
MVQPGAHKPRALALDLNILNSCWRTRLWQGSRARKSQNFELCTLSFALKLVSMDTLSYCHLKRVVRDIKFSQTSCQGQKLRLYTKRNSDKNTACLLVGLQERSYQCLQSRNIYSYSSNTANPSNKATSGKQQQPTAALPDPYTLLFLQIPSNYTFIPSPHQFHPSQSSKSRLTNMAPSLPLHLPPTPCARRQHLRRLVLCRRLQSDSHRVATDSSTPSQRPKRPSMIFEARSADSGASVYATV